MLTWKFGQVVSLHFKDSYHAVYKLFRISNPDLKIRILNPYFSDSNPFFLGGSGSGSGSKSKMFIFKRSNPDLKILVFVGGFKIQIQFLPDQKLSYVKMRIFMWEKYLLCSFVWSSLNANIIFTKEMYQNVLYFAQKVKVLIETGLD